MKNSNECMEGGNSFWKSPVTISLIAFSAGAMAGAVAAALLTPKTGKETRESIMDSANRVKDGAYKVKDDITEAIKTGIDKLKSKATELEDDLKNSVKSV